MAVPVQIESIIKQLENKSIKFIQPIYEAIANSLEANATEIEVEIFHDQPLENTVPSKIEGFKITDNGDGFTQTNREAFNEFWTANKAKMGCKGSGRFLWLTVFNNIHVLSEVATENVLVTIPFDKNFSDNKIKIENKPIAFNKTILEFKNITKRFYDLSKKIDGRFDANLDKICESVQEYLLIKLFLLKNKKILFNIKFKMDNLEKTISNEDIPDLHYSEFKISTSDEGIREEYLFTLYYHFFEDKLGHKKGFYCANDRAALTMGDKDLGFSGILPHKDSFTILLCSEYFNNKDDDSRNGLSVLSHNKDRSITVPLLFSDIRPTMQQKMKEIIKDRYPEIEEINKAAVESAIDAAPHLASIIYSDDDIVKTKESLIKNAKTEFNNKKERVQSKFLKLLRDKSINESAFLEAVDEMSDVAAAELGEYIFYRESIIKALDRAINDLQTSEAFIHNILMKMKTSSEPENNEKYLLSNLWLLDDKFMTYSYVASDTTVKKIVDEIMQKDAKYKAANRPDISIFFNRENQIKDLVMVELKGPNADKDEKNKSITELVNNLDIVKKNINHIGSIWSYIITTIDDDFAQTMSNQEFDELFCNDKDAKIFYRYYKKLNAHVFALDLKAVVSDASARNKTFLEILKKR